MARRGRLRATSPPLPRPRAFLHYRRRARQIFMLQDPLRMTLTPWPGSAVLALLARGVEG